MHIADLDLTQIRLLAELGRASKLSTAAASIGLSQSAASHALAKLRREAGDPLFVRSAGGISPTPYGERLAAAAQRALEALLDGFATDSSFEPAGSRRQFNVYMSDVGQMVMLPKLLAIIRDEAPATSLRACRIPLDQPGATLASGEVDLAIGFFTNLTTGFRQSLLFRERYVCVVRVDHPNFRGGMSLEAFRATPRAIADASGMSHAVMEGQLAKAKLAGAISLRVPDFMVLPLVIANSDLLVVMPSQLADAFSQLVSIKVLRPPVNLPPYDIRIYWHERFHHDPANRWLRRAIIRQLRQ